MTRIRMIMLMMMMMAVTSYTGQPLDAIGGLSSPHLPVHHPYKQPTTNLEVMITMTKMMVMVKLIQAVQVQQQMKDLMNFPLSVFLFIGISNNLSMLGTTYRP